MFDSKPAIRAGEIQVHEIGSESKLLYIRSLNPAETILNWCNNNGYEWLSLPQAVREVGFDKLIALAPKSHEVHWQQATLPSAFGDQERITPSLTFNSYIITKGIVGENPENDQFKVYAGHVLPLTIQDIGTGYRSSPPTLRLKDILQFKQISDITEGFRISGLDEVAWSEADINSSGKLGEALFGASVRAKTRDRKVFAVFPREEFQLSTLDLDSGGSLTAWSFYHNSYEFTNHAIVRKKSLPFVRPIKTF
jgi:hypothetical protein